MYSNLNGLKTTKMKARKLLDKEEFDYDHFTRLTSTGIEPDYNTIAQFAEKYHQKQLKLLNIDNVSNSFCKCVDSTSYYTRVMNCRICNNCGEEVNDC